MSELTIDTSDIAAAIRKNLDGFEPSLEQTQVGRVLEVGDGIARVSGLPDAAVNELLQFESGTFGLALNLDEHSIGAVVLGEVDDIEEGQTVRATLSEITEPVDMVDIFRRSEAVPPIVDEALEAFPDLRTIWMQIGVIHAEAAEVARARGVDVVMNRCPKIEYQRLFGELRMGGFNTGVISSRL